MVEGDNPDNVTEALGVGPDRLSVRDELPPDWVREGDGRLPDRVVDSVTESLLVAA